MGLGSVLGFINIIINLVLIGLVVYLFLKFNAFNKDYLTFQLELKSKIGSLSSALRTCNVKN